MTKTKRLLTRVDDKLLQQITHKLSLKKFDKYNTSKLIRAAIDDFFNRDLFAYVQNTNVIIEVLNEIKLDLSGVIANSTQIREHLIKITGSLKLISSIELIQLDVQKQILKINSLLKILKPFDDLKIKDNLLIVRVENQIHSQIMNKIDEYTFIKFDISKFIRTSLKYYLDKKYFAISDKKITLARELMKNASQVDLISSDINKIAFYFNTEEEVELNHVKENFNNFGKCLNDTYQLIDDLFEESLKEF